MILFHYLSGYSDIMCVLGTFHCFLYRCITPQAGFPALPAPGVTALDSLPLP